MSSKESILDKCHRKNRFSIKLSIEESIHLFCFDFVERWADNIFAIANLLPGLCWHRTLDIGTNKERPIHTIGDVTVAVDDNDDCVSMPDLF